MRGLIARLWREEEGQDLAEYVLLMLLVALTTISAMDAVATGIRVNFSRAAVKIHSS